MGWTCDVSIEEKVRQDCYNRGYEQGRKNPCDEIVAYIEELKKQVKEYQDKIEQGTLKEIPENAVVITGKDLKYYNQFLDFRNDFTIFEVMEKECAKARKETAEKFAERLKQVGELHYSFGEQRYDIATDDIDQICKEITESK